MNGNNYKLIGIINHKGDLSYGHYTCYSYNDIMDKWLFYNDSEVKEV